MKIRNGGITKTIDSKEWGFYQARGWKKASCAEPQPSQEGLYIIDDYTIGRLDNIQLATHL